MYYGYVRVSSREQNEDRQIIALDECGVKIDKLYIDKQSGKDFEREEYQKMLKRLKKGDQHIADMIQSHILNISPNRRISAVFYF